MRTARSVVRWAAITAIAIAPAACSIFSGWGDLEGGSPRRDAGTGNGRDGGTGEEGGLADASLVEREWPYPCTARSCSGQACCIDLAAPGQASCQSSCASPTLIATYCLDDHDCASSPKGKTCCVFPTAPPTWSQVDCASSCNGDVACDPAAPTACAPGKHCVPDDLQILYVCR